ncbi:MAG: hypothetical protein JXR91_13430 [Deltaproteobacteria bacterium]|nr:hypothetical protein [Deltaproteobacteria bacterium]
MKKYLNGFLMILSFFFLAAGCQNSNGTHLKSDKSQSKKCIKKKIKPEKVISEKILNDTSAKNTDDSQNVNLSPSRVIGDDTDKKDIVESNNDTDGAGISLNGTEKRRDAWLNEEIRCRAISTVRLRKCRFVKNESGYSLSFQNDVKCSDVEFDENGDPSLLKGCYSNWLKIPSSNKLKKGKGQPIWSGSHSGWWWKGDKEKYCCPGIWLEAPKSLQ